MKIIKLIIFVQLLFTYFWSAAYAMSPSGGTLEDRELSAEVTPLSSVSLTSLKPGIYESDDIEQILSFPLSNFGEEDLVVFDVDETLKTGLDPYYYTHAKPKTSTHERLMAQPQHTIDTFFSYMFVSSPWALMDERTPVLIKRLQEQKVNCLANTALDAVSSIGDIDAVLLRVKLLRGLNIDFSVTYPQLPHWDFNTLDASHIQKCPPAFRNGVIFSSGISKYVTTAELLRQLEFRPRKVVFVDDSLKFIQQMHTGMDAEGIECYSFLYSKAHKVTLSGYFPGEVFHSYLKELEVFLDRLLAGEDITDSFEAIRRKLLTS